MSARILFGGTAAMLLLTACPSGRPAAVETGGGASPAAAQNQVWPVMTREHVDLWLHGFAMLLDDTARVPLFERGYRDAMVVRRNQANVTTQLDVERERLRARIASRPQLALAQFIALYFGSWSDLRQAIDIALQAQGDLSRVQDPRLRGVVNLFASYFPTAADREWLRVFALALEDESRKFYHDYWVAEQRRREPVLARVDSLWQQVHRPRLQRFLNNSQQEQGEFVLSLPLGGEGRTLTAGSRQNLIAGDFPDRETDAIVAIYVFAHEAIGAIANQVIADHITPAERREGAADRYAGAGLVRGGAMLLRRADPDLVDGYARYYLRAAGLAPSANPEAALAAAFPLPDAIVRALERQIEVVLGGI